MARLLIKNVNVITMENEDVLLGQNVLLEDGLIKAIGNEIADAETIVDGSNKYLIPGLHDMHVHIRNRSELQMNLVHGVTTIREMMGQAKFLTMRDEVNQGIIDSPRMFLCSPIIEGEGQSAMASMNPDAFNVTGNPSEARKLVNDFKADGYDFIKIYDLLSNDVYDAVIDEGKKIGIPVVGHVPYEVSYDKASNSGQKSIEHIMCTETDEDVLSIASGGAWLVPTVMPMIKFGFIWSGDRNEYLANDEKTKYIAKELLDVWKFACNLKVALDKPTLAVWEKRAEYMKQDVAYSILEKMYKAGVKMAAGTDQGIQFVYPGLGLLDELIHYSTCCMTNYDTLKTATVNASELLGNSDVSGTVAVGKNSDLVLLNKNPLEDIEGIKAIEAVFKGDKYYSRKDLDKILEDVVTYCDETKKVEAVSAESAESFKIYQGTYKKMVYKMTVEPGNSGIIVKMMGQSIEYIKDAEDHKFVKADDSDVYIKFNLENEKVVSLDSKFMGQITTMKKVK